MGVFRKASEIKKPSGGFTHPPEIKQVIKEHLMNFHHPATVTSTLMALNRNGLNPDRATIKKYLDGLVASGAATAEDNGGVTEYRLRDMGSDADISE